jgi:hypothetical protein
VIAGSVPFDILPKQGLKIQNASKWDGKDVFPIVEDPHQDL